MKRIGKGKLNKIENKKERKVEHLQKNNQDLILSQYVRFNVEMFKVENFSTVKTGQRRE